MTPPPLAVALRAPWCRMLALACAGTLCMLGTADVRAGAGDSPTPADFAWRATATPPAGSSVVRVALPVQALLRMQSAQASDVRVFNAQGTVVPYALLGAADISHPPVVTTPAYPAHAVYAAEGGSTAGAGAVQVHVEGGEGSSGSAWVRWDGKAPARTGAQPLQAVLIDTRKATHTVAALELQADLPHNALVHMALATSTDLQHWTEVPVAGPVCQFDGAYAPANHILELSTPVALQGRYLRLSWDGQTGVVVRAVQGRVAPSVAAPALLRADLPAAVSDGQALTWQLGFATPVVALHVQAMQDNTLLPVRVAGRMDASQPWSPLASGVVYRLDAVGAGRRNAPIALGHASVRWLRLEPAQGMALPAGGLQVAVDLAPVELAFLASGPGPYTVAVGRAQTPAAAVERGMLSAALGLAGQGQEPSAWAALPHAVLAQEPLREGDAGPQARSGWLASVNTRSAALWAVLVAGVLVLAGVAYSLLRQLQTAKKTTDFDGRTEV